MDELYKIDENISNLDDNSFITLLLYGNQAIYNSNINTKILTFTICFIKKSGRFSQQRKKYQNLP